MKPKQRQTILCTLALCMWLLVACGRRQATPEPATPQPTATVSALPLPPIQKAALREGLLPEFNMPTRLSIAAIELDIPVVRLSWSGSIDAEGQPFSEWDVAPYAAGWHHNSVVPGQPGNTVLSGHNNILGAVFRRLDQLKRNDQVTLWAGDKAYHYRVNRVMILPDHHATLEQRKENADWINSYEDERLTLVSCWPANDNSHRIVVLAFPEKS